MSLFPVKKTVAEYMAELLVVIFGITIAFMLDDWAENRREQQYELEFLENIRDELVLNLDLFRTWETYHGDMNTLFKEFYALQLDDDSVLTATVKLKEILLLGHSLKVFSSAWETTKSSGGLRLIRDSKLKNQISTLYSRYFPEVERVYRRLDDYKSAKLLSFYNQNRAGREPSFTNPAVVKSPLLYNLVRTYQVYHFVLEEKIDSARRNTMEIKRRIEEYIKQL